MCHRQQVLSALLMRRQQMAPNPSGAKYRQRERLASSAWRMRRQHILSVFAPKARGAHLPALGQSSDAKNRTADNASYLQSKLPPYARLRRCL